MKRRIALLILMAIPAMAGEPDFWILAESNAFAKASLSFDKVNTELEKTCSAPVILDPDMGGWDMTNTMAQTWGLTLFTGAAKQLVQKQKFGPAMYAQILQDIGAATKGIYTGTNTAELAKLIKSLGLHPKR